MKSSNERQFALIVAWLRDYAITFVVAISVVYATYSLILGMTLPYDRIGFWLTVTLVVLVIMLDARKGLIKHYHRFLAYLPRQAKAKDFDLLFAQAVSVAAAHLGVCGGDLESEYRLDLTLHNEDWLLEASVYPDAILVKFDGRDIYEETSLTKEVSKKVNDYLIRRSSRFRMNRAFLSLNNHSLSRHEQIRFKIADISAHERLSILAGNDPKTQI